MIDVGHALFFTEEGNGPDAVTLSVQDHPPMKGIPSEPNGRLWINTRLVEGEVGADIVDGGFIMERETVERLYSELGAWLVIERNRSAK